MADAARRATLGEVARSLLFYATFYGGTVLFLLTIPFAAAVFARRLPIWVRQWAVFHRWCARVILRIDIAITGAPPPGVVLVALKHQSFYEAIDLTLLLDHPAVFAKAELLRLPLWGRAGRDYGLIAVEREAGAATLRTMLAAARRYAADGRPLAIFPEGTRVAVGDIAPLQSGFAGLYKLLGLTVVPVAVASGELYHRWWKRPGTIRVAFGAPIPPGLPRAEIEARVLRAINALPV